MIMVHQIEPWLDIAHEGLFERDMYAPTLDEMYLPDTDAAVTPSGDIVPYMVAGDLNEAKYVVYVPAQYSVPVTDDRVKISLMGQQAVLGEDYCVVGMHVFDPKDSRLSREQRKEISNGSFRPLAERMLSVVQATIDPDSQEAIFFGYSMGADVVTEATHGTLFDENMGIVDVANLGVFEPARVLSSRSEGGKFIHSRPMQVLKMTQAFAGSGEDLFFNVTHPGSIALMEANNIDPEMVSPNYTRPEDLKSEEMRRSADVKEQKRFDARVGWYVTKYVAKDVRGSIALNSGFVHDTTIAQINDITSHKDSPWTAVGLALRSTIFTSEAFDRVNETARVAKVTMDGDHSLGDNLGYMGAMTMLACYDPDKLVAARKAISSGRRRRDPRYHG